MVRRWDSLKRWNPLERGNGFWVVLLALGFGYYLSADTEIAPVAESSDVLKRVRVGEVEPATESRELRFSGTTRSARRARFSFSIGGRMVSRPVEIGDRVRSGELLAKLDDLELENAVASARASLAELNARRSQSERDHARTQQLAAAKAATSEELERTAAAVDALRAAEEAGTARLREAERRLAETRLDARFAGTVTEVHLEPGEFARVGSPIVTLAGDGEVELEIEVPESIVPRIAVDAEVEVRVPVAGEESVRGWIKSVGRTAAGPGRLFPVVVGLAASEVVVAGVTAELFLQLTSDRAMTLPVEAVVNPGGRRPAVFRVVPEGSEPQHSDRSRVEKLVVDVGGLLGDRVVVYGDLEVGDQVVVGGQRGLLDGETVKVLQ